MILRASIVWLAPGRVLRDVALTIAGGRVVRIAHTRAAPPRAIFPSLVNAHAHLQLGALRPAERRFVPWLRSVIAQGRQEQPPLLTARAHTAIAALLADGCGAVGEIDSTGASPAALRHWPIVGRCYRELRGFDLGPAAARALIAASDPQGTRDCPAGLSPHAPYSVSPALFAAAAARKVPMAVHVAESEEELALLRSGRGPLRTLLADLGRLPARWRAPGVGPVRYLEGLGVLAKHTTLIHCQHLEPGDDARIARHGAAIVVCPGTIRYFRREPPPVARWLAQRIPVALGTDSLSSNRQLSLRAELALARRLWPALEPSALLAMATLHGGRALARPGLGRLRVGGDASLVVVANPRRLAPEEVVEGFVSGELGIEEHWLHGRRWRREVERPRMRSYSPAGNPLEEPATRIP